MEQDQIYIGTMEGKQKEIDRLQKQVRILQLDLECKGLLCDWLDSLANFHRDVNYDTWDRERIDEAQNEVDELYKYYCERKKKANIHKSEILA